MNPRIPAFSFVSVLIFLGALMPVARADFDINTLRSAAEKLKALQVKAAPSQQPDNQNPQVGSDVSDKPAASGSDGKFDVLGVKLGMPLGAAMKLLKAHNPKFVIGERKLAFDDFHKQDNAWEFSFSDQSSPNKQEQILLYVSLPPRVGVVQIVRDVTYVNGQGPAVAQTIASLKQKYGMPLKENNAISLSQLIWNTTGILIDPNQCYPNASTFGNQVIMLEQPPVRKQCGTVMNVIITPSQNPGIVGKIRIALTGHQMIYERALESEKVIAALRKKKRDSEIENAKNRNLDL